MTERWTAVKGSSGSGDVPAAATWGLLAVFAVHDAEELATMHKWSAKQTEWLRERVPGLSPRVLSALRVDAAHSATAIGLMGTVMAAASAAGARTGGRSGFYQTVLAGFGLHAVTHVGQSAVMRGYTPGVVTAPLVVAPYSCWVWSQLKRAGAVRETSSLSTAKTALLFPAVIGGVHIGAWGLRSLARRAARKRRDAAPRV